MEKTEHEMNYIRNSTQQEEILWNSLNLNNVEENSNALTEKNLIHTSKEIGSTSYDTEIQTTAEEIKLKQNLNPKNYSRTWIYLQLLLGHLVCQTQPSFWDPRASFL